MKKEVRILGLSSRSIGRTKVLFVGVVFRGSRWLDGLFTCLLERRPRLYLPSLAERIMQSKQYTQIQAVILFKRGKSQNDRINASALSKRIRIPVISIQDKRSNLDSNKRCLIDLGAGRPVYVEMEGIDCARTSEIYRTGCARNRRIPEALRIAELIVRRVG